PFSEINHVKAEVFTSMPAKFRNKRRTKWSDPNLQCREVECSIEGPAFDREVHRGHSVRRDLVVQYDGWPNGSKFRRDGRLFVADYRRGIMMLDVKSGRSGHVGCSSFEIFPLPESWTRSRNGLDRLLGCQ